MKIAKLILFLTFCIYLSRAFFVTVSLHGYYEQLASGNQTGKEIIPAARGIIVDSQGKVIANNTEVNGQVVRFYPEGEVVASVVGYIREGQGVTGLESQYQEQLRGIDGERLVEEVASGKETKEIRRTEPVAGKVLTTNLSLPLQANVYFALKEGLSKSGESGAVVVSKVSGEVLALVSLPSFDPNLFIIGGKRGTEGGVYTDASAVVSDEKRKPLFNRVLNGGFPPGSVYKLLTSLAALESGAITRTELIDDSGEIVIGNYRYGNWFFDKYGKTEGKINVEKALARSNDVFYYRVGEKTGVDTLVSWSRKLGLGQKTDIDLPGESAGLMPSPLWQEKTKGERWFLGNTYHLSIGQGNLLATPLQMNRLTAGVISGRLCEPRLVGKGECVDLGVSEATRETIKTGMKMACMEGGTAFPFFSLKGAVFCKTGTAQHGSEKDKPHAWITVVVPTGESVEDWVVVTVMLEEAGEGSEQAGPVARKIVDFLRK